MFSVIALNNLKLESKYLSILNTMFLPWFLWHRYHQLISLDSAFLKLTGLLMKTQSLLSEFSAWLFVSLPVDLSMEVVYCNPYFCFYLQFLLSQSEIKVNCLTFSTGHFVKKEIGENDNREKSSRNVNKSNNKSSSSNNNNNKNNNQTASVSDLTQFHNMVY